MALGKKSPLIGITLDSEEAGGWSKMPWYAIRQNYCESVSRFGAVPLALPHELELVESYLDLLDGLVVTGGAFDIPPSLYGDNTQHATVTTKDRRTQFEWAMAEGMLKRNKPVLGICGGQQLLHVVLGGRLHQHIPDAIPNALVHEQPNPRTEPGHTVAITSGTLLHRILGKDIIEVNSAHHQAASDEPKGVIINARAQDGVIEGIEAPIYRFCLGVQWHPEYHVTEADTKIFEAFVGASA